MISLDKKSKPNFPKHLLSSFSKYVKETDASIEESELIKINISLYTGKRHGMFLKRVCETSGLIEFMIRFFIWDNEKIAEGYYYHIMKKNEWKYMEYNKRAINKLALSVSHT